MRCLQSRSCNGKRNISSESFFVQLVTNNFTEIKDFIIRLVGVCVCGTFPSCTFTGFKNVLNENARKRYYYYFVSFFLSLSLSN